MLGPAALGTLALIWLGFMVFQWRNKRADDRKMEIRLFGGVPATEVIQRITTEPIPNQSRGRHRIEKKAGTLMTECQECGADILEVQMYGSEAVLKLDSAPSDRGNVIVFGNPAVCRYLQSPEDWEQVRQYRLPIYRRHNITCTGFWAGRVNHGGKTYG